MRKITNRFVRVVHGHGDSASLVIENGVFRDLSVCAFEFDGEFARLVNNEVGGFVLVTVSMSSNDDWFGPAWDQSRNVFAENWFSENGASEDVSDGSVW